MKICPKCERQNLNNAAVCKACGASLNAVPNVDVLPDPEPDKRTHIGLAYLFGTLCFFLGFFKELLISNENWSTWKAMMKHVGIDCGAARKPYAPLSAAEERKWIKRFAALGLVKGGKRTVS